MLTAVRCGMQTVACLHILEGGERPNARVLCAGYTISGILSRSPKGVFSSGLRIGLRAGTDGALPQKCATTIGWLDLCLRPVRKAKL